MKCVIRRGRMYLYPRPLSIYQPGMWKRSVYLAKIFRTRREALEYLAASDLPKDECEVLGTVACYRLEKEYGKTGE
jgi:hypothetical protein